MSAVIAVSAALSVRGAEAEEPPYVPSILVVENDAAVEELEKSGVVVWHRRADMVLALVPRGMDSRSRVRGVRHMEKGRRMTPAMDKARSWYGADRIMAGNGLPTPYTGEGVVVGFCDIGFDPNHIAFLDENGRSRVSKLICYNEPMGERLYLDTPEKIAAWKSDNHDEWHGTHVANIMTGSWREGEYYGMAPDAEIVGATAQLYDAGILAACEEIISYARSVGKPAVINLSLSSYTGPHDGTSLFSRYMALLGREAIVCMAIGNAGSHNGSYRASFTGETPDWRVRIGSADWKQFHVMGMTDVWSHDDRPVGVRLLVYDEGDGKYIYTGDVYGPDGPFELTVSSAKDADFGACIEGDVMIRGYVSPLNGRWVTEMVYDTSCDEPNPVSDGKWARREIAFEFTAPPGVCADICVDLQYSRFMPAPGYPVPDSSLSASDICSGENVVSVGMYRNRLAVPSLGGGEIRTEGKELEIEPHSSFGTLINGDVLPHTVAPGSPVVSAVSGDFIANNPDRISGMSAVTHAGGKSYYWKDCLGTSMSTPYVAGVVATWLEACPGLEVDDVLEALRATNAVDLPDNGNPRVGRGYFQPYEGLRFLLDRGSGITPGAVDSASPALALRGDMVEVLNPSGRPLTAAIYSIAGACVSAPSAISGPCGVIDVSHLPPGVYLAKVSGGNGKSVAMKFAR